MLSAAKTALWFAATALCLLSAFTILRIGAHLDRTLSGIDTAVDEVSRPCGAKDAQGKLLATGTLCSVGKMVTKFGDLTVTAQQQVAQTDKLVASTANALDVTTASVQSTSLALNEQLTHVAPALDSLKASSDAIPPAMQSVTAMLEDPQRGVPPILVNANRGVSDFDVLLQSKDLRDTLANAKTVTGNFAAMSTDANVKFHDLLFPPPCRGVRCRIGETINDVRLGAQFIEPAFYLRELLTGESVTVSNTVKVAPAQ
jgi:hypothetical protein